MVARKKKSVQDDPPPKEAEADPAATRPVKRRRGEQELLAATHPSVQNVPGELFGFGAGEDGQLGLGEDDATEHTRPRPVTGIQEVVQVAAGGMHSVALLGDGSVRTSGVNDEAALGRPTSGKAWASQNLPPEELGDSYSFLAIRRPPGLGRVTQVSAGDSHSAALTAAGEVWAWGVFRDATGPFGFAPGVPQALEPALVYRPASEAEQAVKVCSGADHVALLTRGGRVWTWGCGNSGQLGRVGATSILSDTERLQQAWLVPAPVPFARARSAADAFAVDVAAGTYATAALARSGAVFAWGLNNYGQLGLSGAALKVPLYAPMPVPRLSPAGLGRGRRLAALALGQHHTLALVGDGAVLACGRATYGRLGRAGGVDTRGDEPYPVPGEVAWSGEGQGTPQGLAAGLAVSGCWTREGGACLWGFGTNSQLGNGDDDSDRDTPHRLASKRLADKAVIQVAFGGQHTLLLATAKAAAAASKDVAAAVVGAEGKVDGPGPSANGPKANGPA